MALPLFYFATKRKREREREIRLVVSSHRHTVISTIAEAIGRKIKIPASLSARLPSDKKQTVPFIKEAAESKVSSL